MKSNKIHVIAIFWQEYDEFHHIHKTDSNRNTDMSFHYSTGASFPSRIFQEGSITAELEFFKVACYNHSAKSTYHNQKWLEE